MAAPQVPKLRSSSAGRVPSAWTLADLQHLLDDADGVCVFPGGLIDLPEHSRLVVPRGMRIDGNDTVLRVRGSQVPAQHLIDAGDLVDGQHFEVHDLTIEGPDTTTWDPATDNGRAAIAWSLYRTWNASMTVRNVTVTGGYGTAVLRSGGGHLEIADCDLGGWVDGLAVFESHNGHGSLSIRDTVLRAPQRSKYSSIGAYVHPHLEALVERVTAVGWNRYAIYLNGTPRSRGTHQLIEVTAVDCSLVQTGKESTTVLERCREWGRPSNGGSLLQGPVRSQGSRWEGSGMIGVMSRRDVERRFIDDVMAPTGTWMALGDHSTGSVVLERARVRLDGRATLVKLVPASAARVRIDSSSIQQSATSVPLKVEGGTVEMVRTNRPANCHRSGQGRLIG